jgi:hypothetical protein
MTRWKHAGRVPKCTLLVGILLGVASLAMYNSAYASTLGEPPYPGSPALPGIPNGPKLGCTPTGTTSETWVCGFNALSNTTFLVNGQKAGGYQADSNGCVLLVLTFSLGSVQVNGNAPAKTRVGINYLIIQGHKTTKTGTYNVGLRVAFQVPHGNDRRCVTSPVTTTTFPSTTSTVSVTSTLKRPRFPRFTTSTRRNPTTLAKVIETPLEISPNKVILESSLMAAVLAAILSAGALGSIWASEGDDGAAGAGGTDPPGDAGGAPADGAPADGGPPTPPEPPSSPEPPSTPPVPGSGEVVSPPATSAFSRATLRGSSGGGGGT